MKSITSLCVQLSTVSIPQRCCVSVGMVKGATATPSAQALEVWQEGRRCAVGGEGTQRRAQAELPYDVALSPSQVLGDIAHVAVRSLQFHLGVC